MDRKKLKDADLTNGRWPEWQKMNWMSEDDLMDKRWPDGQKMTQMTDNDLNDGRLPDWGNITWTMKDDQDDRRQFFFKIPTIKNYIYKKKLLKKSLKSTATKIDTSCFLEFWSQEFELCMQFFLNVSTQSTHLIALKWVCENSLKILSL